MKTKFDLRKIAFTLVPFKSQEEAIDKIKKKVAELSLSDRESIEFIKQVNAASNYSAYKQANFMMSGTDMGIITVKPAQVFKELAKVSSLGATKKQLNKFSNYLVKVKETKTHSRKLAALEDAFTVTPDPIDGIISIVKLSKLDTDIGISAKIALKDIIKTANQELLRARQDFIGTVTKFENSIKMFPYLRTKYASLIDESKLDFVGNRIPTARDVIEIRDMQEKIASATDRITVLNNILEIIEGD